MSNCKIKKTIKSEYFTKTAGRIADIELLGYYPQLGCFPLSAVWMLLFIKYRLINHLHMLDAIHWIAIKVKNLGRDCGQWHYALSARSANQQKIALVGNILRYQG